MRIFNLIITIYIILCTTDAFKERRNAKKRISQRDRDDFNGASFFEFYHFNGYFENNCLTNESLSIQLLNSKIALYEYFSAKQDTTGPSILNSICYESNDTNKIQPKLDALITKWLNVVLKCLTKKIKKSQKRTIVLEAISTICNHEHITNACIYSANLNYESSNKFQNGLRNAIFYNLNNVINKFVLPEVEGRGGSELNEREKSFCLRATHELECAKNLLTSKCKQTFSLYS